MRSLLLALVLLMCRPGMAQVNFYDPMGGSYRTYSPAPYMGGYVYGGGAYRRPYCPPFPGLYWDGYDAGYELRAGRRDTWIRYYTGSP